MDDLLFLSYMEHQILHHYKTVLESQYDVQLNIPDIKSSGLHCKEDIITVTIMGEAKNIADVEAFLHDKMEEQRKKRKSMDHSIIIVDSDSETSDTEIGIVSKKKKRKSNGENPDLESSCYIIDDCSPPCSTVANEINDSVVIIEDTASPAAEDFIPLISQSESVPKANKKRKNERQTIPPHVSSVDDIIDISSDDEVAIVPKPRRLRPIVIDGSNVARLHGKPNDSFSCQGIKISIDFFLNRGHTEVTAFIPLYRKHLTRGKNPTTNPELLEELEKKQYVVYTPSRRLETKTYSCYDDRFIVELAAKTGGVILSNDNYKDLMNESEAFKKAITERLLMFCFVGNNLMIPQDPLGITGPSLDEYLSFPPDEN